MVDYNLSISRRCNELLLERFTHLECNNLNNAQHNKGETLETNPVPSDIADNVLEQSFIKNQQKLSITRINMT